MYKRVRVWKISKTYVYVCRRTAGRNIIIVLVWRVVVSWNNEQTIERLFLYNIVLCLVVLLVIDDTWTVLAFIVKSFIFILDLRNLNCQYALLISAVLYRSNLVINYKQNIAHEFTYYSRASIHKRWII